MRVGHNSSSSSEEGFESTIGLQMPFVTVEQGDLVGEDRAKSEARRVQASSRWHRPVAVEDGLEVLVEILDCHMAQPMEDAGLSL